MKHAAVLTQVPGQGQERDAGKDRHHNRQGKHPRLVVLRGGGAHGRHAQIVHDADADPHYHSADQAAPYGQLRDGQCSHGHQCGNQYDQQGSQRDGEVIGDFERCLEGQHADEVHRPYATGQAKRAQRFPEPTAFEGVDLDDTVRNVQRGKARSTGHAVSQRDQKQVVTTVDQQLHVRWWVSEYVQTQPIHSLPYSHCKGARAESLAL